MLKMGKFSFYILVDSKIFTYLRNKKELILIVSKKFRLLISKLKNNHATVNGAVWSDPLIFLTH